MKTLPLPAKIYIWMVIASGAVALVVAGWDFYITDLLGFKAQQHLWLLLLGCIAAFGASFLKVKVFVPNQKQRDKQGNISLGFVPTFFLLFGLGPFYAMVASLINMAVMTCYPRRSPYFQVLFSMGAVTISVAAAGNILQAAGLTPDYWQHLSFANETGILIKTAGIAAATTAYSLLNTALVAAAIALTSQKNPFKIWLSHYQWVIPCYYAGASGATIAFGLLPILRQNPWVSMAVGVIAIPIPMMILLIYRYHRQQEEGSLQHIDELQRKNTELESSQAALTLSKNELQQLYTSTVESLALAIDAKDRYTNEHIQRVKEVAVRIGLKLGLEGDDLRALETGALLHDIGKLAIPEQILSKAGRLTDEEFEKIKAHPDMGAKILQPVPFPFPVMPIVRHHHERWDGKGYPSGLQGNAIPLGARILAVADVYDALTSDRSYRRGWSMEKTMEHIKANSGTHFDPDVVDAFFEIVEDYVKETTASAVGLSVRSTVVEEINRASLEYMSLYEISQTASVTLGLSETLSLLASKLRNIFNASACALLLAENNGSKSEVPLFLKCRSASGAGETVLLSATVSEDSSLTAPVLRTRQGIFGAYDPEDLHLTGVQKEGMPIRLPEYQSVMIAPLSISPEEPVLGTINLYQETADAFEVEDLRILHLVAAQVARAIQNAFEFDKTRQSARTDALTGLFNARHLAEFLDTELARVRNAEKPLTVLVLDLDNFKQVNDRFGHTRGNEVLRDLGQVLKTALRNTDLVARYAGDEFVVVLPEVGSEEAKRVVEKLKSVVVGYDGRATGSASTTASEDEDPLGGVRIGISVGIATFPEDAVDAAALIARADRDMYRDKNARKEAEEKAVRLLLADIYPG
jgi:diguanylate cyclase (GGDEF)-like protein/putative nucleotidyltransferase with HDIG domain